MFQDSHAVNREWTPPHAVNREWTPPSVQRSNYTAILHVDFVYASIVKLLAPGCIRTVEIIHKFVVCLG